MNILLEEALNKLGPKESLIIKMRYGFMDSKEHSRSEIGKELGLSTERIRQIEMIALRKLAHAAASRKLALSIQSMQLNWEKGKKDVSKLIEFPPRVSFEMVATRANNKLIEYFSGHPAELKTIDRRLFEEMIAELFKGFGYDVELTKQTRDGGIDIIAVKSSEVNVKYLIQAKRPDPTKKVGVEPVRSLYGVKTQNRATKAILATTTSFTKNAIMEFKENAWELELRDYDGIMSWINAYLRIKGN